VRRIDLPDQTVTANRRRCVCGQVGETLSRPFGSNADTLGFSPSEVNRRHGAIAVVAAIWWALRLQYSAQVQACLSVDLGTPSLPGIGLVDVYSPI
jgi:hypothetical protein